MTTLSAVSIDHREQCPIFMLIARYVYIINYVQWQRIWGGGGGGGGGRAGATPLRIAMNIHSMKLFNNLIKNIY